MRLIAHGPMAAEVSKAGGIGFIGSGNDQSKLHEQLSDAQSLLSSCPPSQIIRGANDTLPIGVGFLNWGADLDVALPLLKKYRPAAVWLFAPHTIDTLVQWTRETRKATDNASKVWIQVCSVAEALDVARTCEPDVLVIQGVDAGGHGLHQGCSICALLPEAIDALQNAVQNREVKSMPTILAAGGVMEGRGLAAALALGAEGVVMGTRYLVADEAEIRQGYKDEVIRATDGGQTTVRTSVYDQLRRTTEWPKQYGGRSVTNQSYHDAINGMPLEENMRLYNEAAEMGDKGWGPQGRMTTYAGTAVGLVTRLQSAKNITKEVRAEARAVIKNLSDVMSSTGNL
jgi:nitronate monooxygenase